MKINDNNDKNVEQNAVVDLKRSQKWLNLMMKLKDTLYQTVKILNSIPTSRTKIKEIIEEYKGYLISEDKDDMKFMDMVSKDDVSLVLFWYFLAVKNSLILVSL